MIEGELWILRSGDGESGRGEGISEEDAKASTGGGGVGLDVEQHQEFSGETIMGVSSFRVWLWFWAVYDVVVGDEKEAESRGALGWVVMVVSRQRRRLGLMGWVWNLRWVVVAAIC